MEATTELKNTGTPLAALPPTDRAYLILSEKHNEQALVELAGKYTDVTEIKDVTDYRLVMRGGIELMKTRTAIEATGKAARDDANKFRKAVISEENRLIAITRPEEDRLRGMRKDYDDEQERIAEEARLVEQRRVTDITERIQAIKRQTDGLLGSDSTAIQLRLDAVNTITCNETLFAEFAEQAAEVKAGVVETLNMLLDARQELEVQMEENERIAQEQAERQADLDQQVREQAARERAAQDKIDAEEAVRQAERERIQSIDDCIIDIRASATGAAGLSADELRSRITALDQTDLSVDVWKEFQGSAQLAVQDTLRVLESALADRVKLDEEKADIERREAEQKAIEEAEQQRQAEVIEADRQEALRPDKDKLLAWAVSLQEIQAPIITDIQLQSYRNSALERVSSIGEELVGYIERF